MTRGGAREHVVLLAKPHTWLLEPIETLGGVRFHDIVVQRAREWTLEDAEREPNGRRVDEGSARRAVPTVCAYGAVLR